MNNSDVLRERIASGTVLMPGVWDPLSALLAEQAGFDTVFVSGFALAGTLLGVPDIGILGRAEVADAARRISTQVPEVSVVVDADTGYGDESEVRRTVALWEESGAAGIFLEDQVWPKRCGHMSGKEVVEARDWIASLRAALSERSDLHVTARTDARAVHGLDDAIERAKMARDLGVDAVFVEAPESIEEMEQIASSLAGVTLVANMVEAGRTPLLTPEELAEMGFRLVVSPLSGLLSAAKALGDAYVRLRREGTLRGHPDTHVSFNDFTSLVGLEKHLANDPHDR